MIDKDKPLYLWRLRRYLTVDDASLLMIGVDPATEFAASVRQGYNDNAFADYYAVRSAIMEAALENEIVYTGNTNEENAWYSVIISVESLIVWLKKKRFADKFFVNKSIVSAAYLDHNHPRYAPKLAAAIHAWLATDGDLGSKSPKQALAKWLREKAATFGLTDEEGKPKRNRHRGMRQGSELADTRRGTKDPGLPASPVPPEPSPRFLFSPAQGNSNPPSYAREIGEYFQRPQATRSDWLARPERRSMSTPQQNLERRALSIPEAARTCGLCRATLYRLIADGKLSTLKIGARRLVPGRRSTPF